MPANVAVAVEAAQFKAGVALLKSADKKLMGALRKSINDAAKPLGWAITNDVAAHLPKRGGLAKRFEKRIPRFTVSNTGVRLRYRAARDIERGLIRHPVFAAGGNGRGFNVLLRRGGPINVEKTPWVAQVWNQGLYQRALNARLAETQRLVSRHLEAALSNLQTPK